MNTKIQLSYKFKSAVMMVILTMSFTASMAQTCSDKPEPSSDTTVSYEFNEIELSSVLQLAALTAEKVVIGMELLDGKIVSASANEVNVTAFVDALLLVNGFGFEEQGENWVISKM